MKHILLIDASGFAYRAYHAGVKFTRPSDGMPIHAILGYMKLVWALMGRAEKDPYDYAAAVFDAPGKTFRHKAYPKYKAQRSRPDDLLEQLPILREASRILGFTPVEVSGFEADDVIASLAEMAVSSGVRVTISTIDKDFAQLVGSMVTLADPVKRTRVGHAEVVEKFGVHPDRVIDVQTLAGDPVDNIPGVPGLGIKTAAGLIRRFGTLNALMRAIDKPRESFAPTIRANLKREQKNLRLYRKLVTLRRDVPIFFDLDDFIPKASLEDHRRDFLRVLEAEGHYDRIFRSGSNQLYRVVPASDDPFEWWSEELIAPGQVVPELPQCGFYKRKLALGVPGQVVARIWREPELDFLTEKPTGNDLLLCEVGGTRKDPYDQWGFLCCQPIMKGEFETGASAPPPLSKTKFDTLPPPTRFAGRKRA